MRKNPFAPDHNKLPETLPIFPLDGVLLLPGGNLPLNIFEEKYLAMTNDSLSTHRLIGMVQPRQTNNPNPKRQPVYRIGCVGKITEYTETQDGRYLISLTGISRFHIEEELETISGYRRIKPEWDKFEKDIYETGCLNLDRTRLKTLLAQYFKKEGMECDWQAIENTNDNRLITCLAMTCPFTTIEKQALLEAPCCTSRAEKFMTILEMTVRTNKNQCSTH